MIYVLVGLLSGIGIGFLARNGFVINPEYSIYILLIILALTNSIFNIISKKNMSEFKIIYCFMYIFVDIIMALAIGFISEKLGLPFYLALIFAFGNNIYKCVASLINSLVTKKVI